MQITHDTTNTPQDMEERIRQVMEYMQMKQKDFATKIGISEASLSGVFNGRTKANDRYVKGIHEAFPQIDLTWLLFGTGDMLTTRQSEQSTTPLPSSEESDGEQGDSNGGNFFQMGDPITTPTMSAPQKVAQPIANTNSLNAELMQELQHLRELKNANYFDKKIRKVLEIRVFFDDGTYESFTPSSK